MAFLKRHWQLAGLIVAVFLTMGCNPATALYFLLLPMDGKLEPPCKLAPVDKHKQLRVVVLTSLVGEPARDLVTADRDLTRLLVRKLEEASNKETVKFASARNVQDFKEQNPNWQSMSLEEVGKKFHADRVILLEIGSLSLFESGNANTLYRGRARISVTVVDASKNGDDPIFTQEYATVYPLSRWIMTDDKPVQQFRQEFLDRVATELSWYFISHEREEAVSDHITVD